MRIRRLHIHGYGRFRDHAIEFDPGIQVIVGPNEQGKSTLRSFIADMLYGQKRSPNQRLYEPANELKQPWDGHNSYGGRLVYQLDSSREIEVFRNLDRDQETVQIFDLTHAREITNEFERLRNREPMFADAHLGISKAVFLHTANITHMTLEDLGDSDAIEQIREKLLSLADTGGEQVSTETALKWVETRITAIGPATARTRPLPASRNRLIELTREAEDARQLLQSLAAMEQQRRETQEQIAALVQRIAAIESEMGTLDRVERARRLSDAEGIQAHIDELTPRCFSLRTLDKFPLHRRHDFQRCDMQANAARDLLARVIKERSDREAGLAHEIESLGRAAAVGGGEISEEHDRCLAELEEKIRALIVRREDTRSAREASVDRMKAAEKEVAELPDFSRIQRDPVSLLNQLAASFRLAQSTRDEQCARRGQLNARLEERSAAIAEPERIFGDCPDFEAAVREYEVKMRMREKEISDLETAIESLHTRAEEEGARIPGFVSLAVLTGLLFVALIIVAAVSDMPGIFIPAGLTGLALLYFIFKMMWARATSLGARRQAEEAEARAAQLRDTEEPECVRVENMMSHAGCGTVRELEAKYDFYRKARLELDATIEAAELQRESARQAEAHVAELFESYIERFREVGEELEHEEDIELAARRGAGRYQAYRDAKRRLHENREQVERHDAELARIEADLDALHAEELELTLKVRQMMRENGYPEECKQENVLTALRSYRIRSAQLGEKRRGLERSLGELDERIAEAEAELHAVNNALAGFLEEAGVISAAEWYEKAAQAEEYQQLRQQISAMEDKLNAVLMGQDLTSLRAAIQADGPAPETPMHSLEDLKQRRATLQADLEARRKEEHALHLALTERAAGKRSLSEIEEERAQVEARVRELEFELDAASHAAALIEEVAADKHARIAPRLTERASRYLAEITGGAYTELLVNRDMRVSVRIPATNRMNDEPELVLSKGTVDQIYLALRLAMVQCISESNESIPMLLDDPFANYDDIRLAHALDLLRRLAAENQIVLFTCREDVARAAVDSGAPLMYL